MNNSPIGVFDSGLGGLTVWREVHDRLPHESLIYYGDGKNCPYGNQSQAQVISHVDYAVERLIEEGVKMIVVACNAATAMAIDHLRGKYSIPFVGLEPAVKPAAISSKSGVIGILATAATFKGRHLMESIRKYSDRVEIMSAVGEGFVELVESDFEDTTEARRVVASHIEPMIARGADRIVLGCTHYPFLAGAMRDVIGDRDVELVNPAPAVERRVEALLEELDLHATDDNVAQYSFMTSSDEAYRRKLEEKSKQALEADF